MAGSSIYTIYLRIVRIRQLTITRIHAIQNGYILLGAQIGRNVLLFVHTVDCGIILFTCDTHIHKQIRAVAACLRADSKEHE